jgi:NADH-quinone oxidoreductase subunit M
MNAWMTPWLLLAVPFTGVLLSTLVWSKPRMFKTGLLLTTAASLLTVIGAGVAMGSLPSAMGLLCLLPTAAFASLLGQPVHRDHRTAWLMTVVTLGFGQAAVSTPTLFKPWVLGLLLLFLIGLLAQSRNGSAPSPTYGMVTYGAGAVAALVSAIAPGPISALAGLLVSLVLIPLFPLQAGHVACLTRLPGNLPAFLSLALPVAGLTELVAVLPSLPEPARHGIGWLALAGMLYGTARSLAQSRPLPLLAHSSLAFFSIFWWYVAISGSLSSQAALFVSAVGLTTGGLHLGWHAVRVRYGDLDLRALGGLVQPMPRFASLFSLLALAALGFPPFGVFSGFMGMVLHPDVRLPGSFAVVALVWLAASWYFLDLMQRLLFGRPRPDLQYKDVRETELASLALVLVLLAILGVIPSTWFDAGTAAAPFSPSLESSAWNH